MWGCDVINMTTVPEAVLAREAGICYQPIAMSTDYDCFMEKEEKVTVDLILKTLGANSENVKKILVEAIPKINEYGLKEKSGENNKNSCTCRTEIDSARI